MSHAAKLAEATVATKTKAEALATVGIITPDVEIREAADATDDDETANQGRGDDLDRTEADRGQPTLAPGTPDGPVGHDHGGAPSEPESATQSDPASAPPGRAPTTEDLDPLDPGHLVCPDCPTVEADDAIATVGQACASLGIEVDDAPIEVAS